MTEVAVQELADKLQFTQLDPKQHWEGYWDAAFSGDKEYADETALLCASRISICATCQGPCSRNMQAGSKGRHCSNFSYSVADAGSVKATMALGTFSNMTSRSLPPHLTAFELTISQVPHAACAPSDEFGCKPQCQLVSVQAILRGCNSTAFTRTSQHLDELSAETMALGCISTSAA